MWLRVAEWAGAVLMLATGVGPVVYFMVVGPDEVNGIVIGVLLGLGGIASIVSRRSVGNSEVSDALYSGLIFSAGSYAPIRFNVPSTTRGSVSDTANDPQTQLRTSGE